jgi:acyl-CoA reductase-like NAD-dependent aldehyde dehydrogenase
MTVRLTIGNQEFELEGGLSGLTVNQQVLDAQPDLAEVLRSRGARLDKTIDISAVKDGAGRYLNYLDGRWSASEGVQGHENIDPARVSTSYGKVPESTSAEVDRACQAAQRDFDAWRASSADARVKIFTRLAELIKAEIEPLAAIMTREMGKSLFDSKLDILEAIGVCEAIAPQGVGATGVTYPTILRGLIMESRLAPRGVAAIVTPFNFPLAIPLAQVVSALVTGNTVVWKPAHLVPESSHALSQLILRAFSDAEGLWIDEVPSGVFHMVQGDATTGDALCRHPLVRALSFTGSKAVGDVVDATASALGKRVMKEVAGINCFYVHESADLDRAAKNFVYGKTITSGQRCTSIQEVLVDEPVVDAFVTRVRTLMEGIVYGPGDSSEVTEADAIDGRFSLPPVVSQESQQRIVAWLEQSLSQGAKVAAQMPVPADLRDDGWYVPFTLVTDVHAGNILDDHEVFGPVGILRPMSGLSAAIEHINGKIGIVACIDAKDKDASETFIDRVLRTRIDDGRHGTGCFFGTKFGGDRGAGSGNPALDADMVMGYLIWKTIYRSYEPQG